MRRLLRASTVVMRDRIQQSIKLYKIAKDDLRGATSTFLKSDEFGKLRLTFPTLTRYFGNDFYKIQPALYYREYNIKQIRGSKDLSTNHLLTKEFEYKIRHLYENFYTVLSENYENNQEIKATFHIEKSLGLGGKTRITTALTGDIKRKFRDLIGKNHNLLSFTIRTDEGNVVNERQFKAFVASITFYLVMFNAIGIIGDDNLGYKLFVTQRKIYNNDYIIGLYSKGNLKSRLSQDGEQIYNIWQARWNQDENGRPMWNLEDCWPVYLLDDPLELISFFERIFNIRIRSLEN